MERHCHCWDEKLWLGKHPGVILVLSARDRTRGSIPSSSLQHNHLAGCWQHSGEVADGASAGHTGQGVETTDKLPPTQTHSQDLPHPHGVPPGPRPWDWRTGLLVCDVFPSLEGRMWSVNSFPLIASMRLNISLKATQHNSFLFYFLK